MGKFVSDVLDIDKVVAEHGNKIFLIAGVGSGKSTWVKEVLTKKGNVLFVTSRKAKVEEDIHDSCFSEFFEWHTNDNQTLITNAKLHSMVQRITADFQKDLDDFIGHFDYIVIDEVHSIATDSAFANNCYGVLAFIEYAVQKNVAVVAMTGTPEPIQWYFQNNNWLLLDYRKICNYVHPAKIVMWNKRSVLTKILQHWNENKIVYFANNTDTMVELCKELLKDDRITADEIATIVSRNKEKEFNEKLKKGLSQDFETIRQTTRDTYKSLIEEKKIPDKCKILLSTSTLREGVDIENENIVMFCDNHILSNLVQFFGRARKSGCVVYIIEDSKQHSVSHSKLLFDYALQIEINTANFYLKSHIEVVGNPFIEIEKMELINHVCKNPYIEFDYIENLFKLFDVKFAEEERLKSIISWKMDLLHYCRCWNIPLVGDLELTKTMNEALKRMYECRGEYSIEYKEAILDMLKRVYQIKVEQPAAINEKLAELGAEFRIIYGKWNSGEKRNKSYWKFVSVEEHKEWIAKK